ncbi:hypothetical protein NtRootA9_38330 [Arthrobacter sp. NtRootA9]|nr:hypothetical protein NtRootA9_38330 [Arthrobacter sp. NtRootA9]
MSAPPIMSVYTMDFRLESLEGYPSEASSSRIPIRNVAWPTDTVPRETSHRLNPASALDGISRATQELGQEDRRNAELIGLVGCRIPETGLVEYVPCARGVVRTPTPKVLWHCATVTHG